MTAALHMLKKHLKFWITFTCVLSTSLPTDWPSAKPKALRTLMDCHEQALAQVLLGVVLQQV